MDSSHSLELSDHIKIKSTWLEAFAGLKDDEMTRDIPPALMHEFSSNSEPFIPMHNQINLVQNIDDKHNDFYQKLDQLDQNSSSSHLTNLIPLQDLNHFEQNGDDLDHILKSDTKKHRRKAAAPQRAVPKVLANQNEVELSTKPSGEDLPLGSQDCEKIKTEKLSKMEEILEYDPFEDLRSQKLSNLERMLNAEDLLDEKSDNFFGLESGEWRKFLNEFETQNIFKDLQEEGDNEILEPEIFSNVKEEFKAHWGVKCNMCESVFSYKTEFDKHYVNSYKLNPVYTCTFCNKSVDKYPTFRSHCYRHITEGRFKCKSCPKGFSLQSMLQVHILTKHTECKPYMCEECGRSFVTKPGLKIHLRKHKMEVKEDYPCVECGKVLHTRGGLTSHMNVHRLGRRFMCDICGKTFTQKVNMQHHVKQHTGFKPHVCKICEKGFTEKSHLARHLSFHSNERPYKCSICNKMYKTERCLKVHGLVHSEARPYNCDICKKGFLSSTKLKQHENIHTGERPFKCKYCERTFTNYPNWLKHIKRRHKAEHKTGQDLLEPQLLSKTVSKPETTNCDKPKVDAESQEKSSKCDIKTELNDRIDTSNFNKKIPKKEIDQTINELDEKVNDMDLPKFEKFCLRKFEKKNQQLLSNDKINIHATKTRLWDSKYPLPITNDELHENEDKTHLDHETNLMLDKNLDLDGKSLILDTKNLFSDEPKSLNAIEKLKLFESVHLQNSLTESLLLNDLSIFKSDIEDSIASDSVKAFTTSQLEFLAGNSNSNSMSFLVPYLQTSLPNQTIFQNPNSNPVPQLSEIVSSSGLGFFE